MPRADYKTCRICGKHVDEVGPLSHTRQCVTCWDARLTENVNGIHRHDGPAFLRWRRTTAASVGAILLDDLPPEALQIIRQAA